MSNIIPELASLNRQYGLKTFFSMVVIIFGQRK